jgi:hypothetical protein
MAITKVQGVTVATAATNTVTTSFTNTPTSGNLLIAVLQSTANGTPTGDSVTGFTFAVRVQQGGAAHLALYYKVAGASESKNVVGTWTSSTNLNLAIMEWSGITSATLDKTASTATTGSGVTSRSSGTTATTTANIELCIAAFGQGNTTTAQSFSNSFTDEFSPDTVPMAIASLITSSTGTYETTESWTTSRVAGGLIATFKDGATLIGNPFYRLLQGVD